jgi:hypothetical protein
LAIAVEGDAESEVIAEDEVMSEDEVMDDAEVFEPAEVLLVPEEQADRLMGTSTAAVTAARRIAAMGRVMAFLLGAEADLLVS